MAGKPRQKVFCQGITRLGNPCKAKGFLCLNGKWLCRFHGYQNKQGYLKPRFTKESRIKMLKTLYQFRNYTDNDFEKHYQEKIIPRLNNRTSEYNRSRTHIRKNAYRNIFREKSISGQLTEILRYVKKKQRVRDKDH